mmetsp:Transcript_53479/g.125071  ORF Transcript_53479/g.125071 Transcript_53479/m.125071 type:complete len:214 (-) Transcript_53479:1528-2169(-)
MICFTVSMTVSNDLSMPPRLVPPSSIIMMVMRNVPNRPGFRRYSRLPSAEPISKRLKSTCVSGSNTPGATCFSILAIVKLYSHRIDLSPRNTPSAHRHGNARCRTRGSSQKSSYGPKLQPRNCEPICPSWNTNSSTRTSGDACPTSGSTGYCSVKTGASLTASAVIEKLTCGERWASGSDSSGSTSTAVIRQVPHRFACHLNRTAPYPTPSAT